MHEEQENDGGRCCPFEKYRGLSPARQQACNQHRRDEKNREDIRAETKHQMEQRLLFIRGGLPANRSLARALLKSIVTVLDLIFFKRTYADTGPPSVGISAANLEFCRRKDEFKACIRMNVFMIVILAR